MYLLQKIFLVVLTVLILNISIGCATQGGLPEDGIVNLKHFSLSGLENPPWIYGYNRSSKEHFFRLSNGGVEYSINFKEIRVSSSAHLLKGKRNAAAYFVFGGVILGLGDDADGIELKGPHSLEQFSVNDKTFYTLNYKIKNIDYCSNEEVYVYFPFEKQNDYYLYVHYKVIAQDCLKFTKAVNPEHQEVHQEFLSFLGSLVHKL